MTSDEPDLPTLASFLSGFASVGQVAVQTILVGHAAAAEVDDRVQRSTADDFNLLDVLGVASRETRHCRVLAWLLDHRRHELGTHAQGPLGFRLFLKAVGLPATYADHDYDVRREVSGDRSRIDVEVSSRGHFLIHVEAKVFASLGRAQLQRELDDARHRAAVLDVSDPHAVHVLYLTRDGTKPAGLDVKDVKAIRWQTVARVAERFGDLSAPPDVRLFANHYAQAVRVFATEVDAPEVQPG